MGGSIVAAGPPPGAGAKFVQVGTGGDFSVARRDDGTVVAWGFNFNGEGNVPPLPANVTYKDIAVGSQHTVALRSDGQAVDFGRMLSSIPPLPPGLHYEQAGASQLHAVLLRSDGVIINVGGVNSLLANVPRHLQRPCATCASRHVRRSLSPCARMARWPTGVAYRPTLMHFR